MLPWIGLGVVGVGLAAGFGLARWQLHNETIGKLMGVPGMEGDLFELEATGNLTKDARRVQWQIIQGWFGLPSRAKR